MKHEFVAVREPEQARGDIFWCRSAEMSIIHYRTCKKCGEMFTGPTCPLCGETDARSC